jgi:hypothetical protein
MGRGRFSSCAPKESRFEGGCGTTSGDVAGDEVADIATVAVIKSSR